MDLSVIIASLAALVLIVILIRLTAKHAFKILAVAVVLAALGVYLFVVFGNADEDINFVELMTEYNLEDLEDLYCTEDMSRTDSLKCQCIVKPLLEDMQSRFTETELDHLRTRRLRYAAELAKSFRNQKERIKRELEANNASHLLKDIGKDLKKKSKKFQIKDAY